MITHRPAVFAASFLLTATACRTDGDKSDTATKTTCDAPIADAGADLTSTLGGPVTLDGGASTFCASRQDDVTYEWTFESAPPDSIIDTSALSDNQTVSALQPLSLIHI